MKSYSKIWMAKANKALGLNGVKNGISRRIIPSRSPSEYAIATYNARRKRVYREAKRLDFDEIMASPGLSEVYRHNMNTWRIVHAILDSVKSTLSEDELENVLSRLRFLSASLIPLTAPDKLDSVAKTLNMTVWEGTRSGVRRLYFEDDSYLYYDQTGDLISTGGLAASYHLR
jgi:hypothetical protein